MSLQKWNGRRGCGASDRTSRMNRLSAVGRAAGKLLDTLESRRMFDSVPWVITGTDNADQISLSQGSGSNGAVYIAKINGQLYTKPQSIVSVIRVLAKGGNDVIDAGGISNKKVELFGGAGDDLVKGGQKNDLIRGGGYATNGQFPPAEEQGNDTLWGNGGDDDLAAPMNGKGDLHGGNGDDILRGYAGADTLKGDADNDTILGGANADVIFGGSHADNIDAGDGYDTVKGEGGDDFIQGGKGNDSILGQHGNDTVYAGDGNDTAWGGDHNDKLVGQSGDDYLVGEAGNDELEGNAGNDTLFGLSGNDTITGGLGRDQQTGNDGVDHVKYTDRSKAVRITVDGNADDGEQGEGEYISTDFERYWGGSGNDFIQGDDKSEHLYGMNGNDTLVGNGGDDALFGYGGSDQLTGGAGKDQLAGENGDDSLWGGAGEDHYLGGAGSDMITSVGGGKDRVDGGAGQYDVLWVGTDDTLETLGSDDKYENEHDGIQRVGSFSNGASLELSGQDIADPSLTGYTSDAQYGTRFSGRRLFKDNMPSIDDIDQGGVGDCYFLATIAGAAKAQPQMIRQRVVDFGDGTYGVKLWNSDDKAKYFRVDNQLAEYKKSAGNPYFNGWGNWRGQQMWASIMEKAYATMRGGWDAISGDYVWKGLEALGMDHDTDETVLHSEASMAQKMQYYLKTGGVVVASTDIGVLGAELTNSHVYTIVSVSDDLKTVRIRNPWAIDDPNFQQGAEDGYSDISMTQFDDDFWSISYGRKV